MKRTTYHDFTVELAKRPGEADSEWESFAQHIEARILIALGGGKYNLYGTCYSPGPFRETLVTELEKRNIAYLQHTDYVTFRVYSVAEVTGILGVVNWISTVIFRIDDRGIENLEAPSVSVGWLFNKPLDWFEKNVHKSIAFCWLATSPYMGIDIRSTFLNFDHVHAAIRTVSGEMGMEVQKNQMVMVRIEVPDGLAIADGNRV